MTLDVYRGRKTTIQQHMYNVYWADDSHENIAVTPYTTDIMR